MSCLFELLRAEEILVCTDNKFIFNLLVIKPTHLQLHPDIQEEDEEDIFIVCNLHNQQYFRNTH